MNQDFELKKLGQIKYFNCRELDDTNLVMNAFTTRFGGVSKSPFNNLNLAYNIGDKESNVAENRKIIFFLARFVRQTTLNFSFPTEGIREIPVAWPLSLC